MNKQNQTQSSKGESLKNCINALKMCQSFTHDFLRMYNKKEIGKHTDDAITTASCINDCCKAFIKNFNQYLNTTNNK